MKREIKFRGLTDGEAPTWIYGSLVNNLWVYSELAKYPKGSSVCEIITGKYEGDCWEDVAEDCGNTIVTVIPDSVGQYTGLTDKNGKEIYEGDVLTGRNKVNKIVKWDDKSACFIYEEQFIPKPYRISFEEMRIKFKTSFVKDLILPNHEVIGNIHETPELLNIELNAGKKNNE